MAIIESFLGQFDSRGSFWGHWVGQKMVLDLTSCILAEAVARRNSISRRHFESNHSEVAARREEENRRKEIELNSKLNQAQQNNQLLV